MARKKKTEKIELLDLKIQELIKEKEKQLERLERHIGKLVIKNWGTYDEVGIEKVIISFAENAKKMLSEEKEADNTQVNIQESPFNNSVNTENKTY